MAEDSLTAPTDEVSNPGPSDPRHIMHRVHASTGAVWLLVLYCLGCSAAVALLGIVHFSRVTDPPASPPAGQLPLETSLLILVALAGALGGTIHLLTSLGRYVGERKFLRSWIIFYLLRPVAGAGLAVVVYFTIRMASPRADVEDLSLFSVLSFAALSGLFARRAIEKLDDVFETMFKKVEKKVEQTALSKLLYHAEREPLPPLDPDEPEPQKTFPKTQKVLPQQPARKGEDGG